MSLKKKSWANARFDNSYARLSKHFYTKIKPTPVKQPDLFYLNPNLANELNLDVSSLNSQESLAVFSGNITPVGSTPLAMVYAGHQFGQFVDQLGDGRAHLLGELINKQGERFDLQLKGSGPTPYSRNGDGRAALGPVIRETILSEAMHALNIPTTRTLAAISSGEGVIREQELPGAVLTRVAKSHIRVGTFEYFKHRKDYASLKHLADYVINRHYPSLQETEDPYLSLLETVIETQAKLIANWLRVGFIHGVMNTDNVSITGETLDYGPCAFLDEFNHQKVFSAIDRSGRYAYGNQARIGLWNMVRFAETILPFLHHHGSKAKQKALDALAHYETVFRFYWLKNMRQKLGLIQVKPHDSTLINSLLQLMEEKSLDFTQTFTRLTSALAENNPHLLLETLGSDSNALAWLQSWKVRLNEEGQAMVHLAKIAALANPVYIARNHQVEKAIQSAMLKDDYTVMNKLMVVLSSPYQRQENATAYESPPKEVEKILHTFCGT